jgi:hypothetical protein
MTAASSISKYRTATVMNQAESEVEQNLFSKFWQNFENGELPAVRLANVRLNR